MHPDARRRQDPPADRHLILVTDNLEDAVCLVVDTCKEQERAIQGRARSWIARGRRRGVKRRR